jgi:uncharacterized protein (TIGR00661 family)
MARILYSLSGVGWGHSSRSKVVLEHLLFDKKHEVKVVTSGRGYEYLRDDFDVQQILGFRFAFKGGEVDVANTIKENAKRLLKEGSETIKFLVKFIDEFKPDLAISDYEPFLTTVSAAKYVPLISINHVNIIANGKLDYPKAWEKERLLALAVCKMMNVSVEYYFIPSFYFPEIKDEFKTNTTLVKPVLRNEVLLKKSHIGDHVLVYVTTQETQEMLLPLLEKLEANIIAYGFEQDRSIYKNIVFKEQSTEVFLEDLASSSVVITNTGFNVISEALYFGKPVYTIPIHNQFEQMVNGYYLERLGYGLSDLSPSVERIHSFLIERDKYRANIVENRGNFSGNEEFFRLLDSKIDTITDKITV